MTRTFNRPVQGVASDFSAFKISFVMWDEDHGHVVDEDDVVHRVVVRMLEDTDGTNQRVGNPNVNPCAVGVSVPRSVNVTCLVCLAHGPVQPRKQP